jgi:hypothetical protein
MIPAVRREVSLRREICACPELTGPGWVTGAKQDDTVGKGEGNTSSCVVVPACEWIETETRGLIAEVTDHRNRSGSSKRLGLSTVGK